MIIAHSLSLDMASDQTQIENSWFPSASRQPRTYMPLITTRITTDALRNYIYLNFLSLEGISLSKEIVFCVAFFDIYLIRKVIRFYETNRYLMKSKYNV